MTTERMNATRMKGEPVTLVGKQVNSGDKAPVVDLTDTKLAHVEFNHMPGKTCILTSVPSLDTSVCDKEMRYFNKAALKFDDVEVVTVSMDLPFAQSRWCESARAENITAYSDHRTGSFGKAYGVLIKEHRLLSRAVFIIDKEGIIQYTQYVPEITDQPDYDDVLSSLGSVK